jgi:hypothetical protein
MIFVRSPNFIHHWMEFPFVFHMISIVCEWKIHCVVYPQHKIYTTQFWIIIQHAIYTFMYKSFNIVVFIFFCLVEFDSNKFLFFLFFVFSTSVHEWMLVNLIVDENIPFSQVLALNRLSWVRGHRNFCVTIYTLVVNILLLGRSQSARGSVEYPFWCKKT